MLPNRPKEEIDRDLTEQATKMWGAERAKALKGQIAETAGWLAQIAAYPVAFDGDEPDFLAPPPETGRAGAYPPPSGGRA